MTICTPSATIYYMLKQSFMPYKVLAILLYPINEAGAVIGMSSWEERTFEVATLARVCRTTSIRMRLCLEFLRQAGFITDLTYVKAPGRYGRLSALVRLRMP